MVILFYNAVQTLKDDQMRDSRMMSTSENNPILVQNQEWLGEFIASEPGPHALQITLWVFYGPRDLAGQSIAWNDDGTPAVPVGVIWSDRVVLERSVEVRESSAE